MALTAIHLHGPLARDFGKVWTLDIGSPAEAVRAIEANRPGFMQAIMDLDAKGLVFRVRAGKGKRREDLGEEDICNPIGSRNRVDIIPIVVGAGAGIRFITGALMVAVALNPATFGLLAMNTAGAWGAQALMGVGMSLMLGAVSEWLTPKPPGPGQQAASLNSYSFNGPQNNVDQGLPVPVIYGEVLAGSYVVSAEISTQDLIGGGTLGLTLDGQTSQSCALSSGTCMNTFKLVARPHGVVAPLYYSWSTSSVVGNWLVPAGVTGDSIQLSASNGVSTASIVVSCQVTDGNSNVTSTSVTLTSSHTQYAYDYSWSNN